MARYLDNGKQFATFAANLNDRLKMIETTPLFDIHQTQTSRLDQVDFDALEFGRVFSRRQGRVQKKLAPHDFEGHCRCD